MEGSKTSNEQDNHQTLPSQYERPLPPTPLNHTSELGEQLQRIQVSRNAEGNNSPSGEEHSSLEVEDSRNFAEEEYQRTNIGLGPQTGSAQSLSFRQDSPAAASSGEGRTEGVEYRPAGALTRSSEFFAQNLLTNDDSDARIYSARPHVVRQGAEAGSPEAEPVTRETPPKPLESDGVAREERYQWTDDASSLPSASEASRRNGSSFPIRSSASARSSLDSNNMNHGMPSLGEELPLLSHPSPSHGNRIQNSVMPEVLVPRWQPDAEVTICPICRTQFSFFNRKHHCRKCGRVVCSQCSPHRITIPFQYIVQPPAQTDGSTTQNRMSVDLQHNGGSSAVLSLGGGERVRLCNPCVPDPNTTPPQQNQRPSIQHQSLHSRSISTYAAPGPQASSSSNPVNVRPQPRQSGTFETSVDQVETLGPSWRPDTLEGRARSSTVGTRHNNVYRNSSYSSRNPSATLPSLIQPSQQQYRPLLSHGETVVSGPLHVSTRPRHRHRIAEEDECWVCHQELPSRSLPNFQELREAHTATCLDNAMQGFALSTSTPNSGPQIRGRGFSPAAQATSSSTNPPTPTPIASTPEARAAAREQAHAAIVLGNSSSNSLPSRRPGIFPYSATEKDCIDDAECTICLEDIEVGARMARLECLCKFHLQCIQTWFVNRPGQCPVHQHS